MLCLRRCGGDWGGGKKKLTAGDWEDVIKEVALIALGPLCLTHEDLWCRTLGEIEDLIYAYQYRAFLSLREKAQTAAWIMNAAGTLKHQVSAEDLVGHWVDGKIMSKGEYFDYCKEKIKQKKDRKEGRDG